MTEFEDDRVFHVLRNGAGEPIGPFSQNELMELLNRSEVQPDDYVHYPELTDWTPMTSVFEFHNSDPQFVDEGQNPEISRASYSLVKGKRLPGEEIYYVAVQLVHEELASTVLLETPMSIVLTNLRIFIIQPRVIGDDEAKEIQAGEIDKLTHQLNRVQTEGTLRIWLKNGTGFEFDNLPASQIAIIDHLANQLY